MSVCLLNCIVILLGERFYCGNAARVTARSGTIGETTTGGDLYILSVINMVLYAQTCIVVVL